MFIQIQTPGVNKVVLLEQPGWVIRHNRLFDVSPDAAPSAVVIGGNVSIWTLCFTEDLLQAVNEGKGLLLDVGWYPEADPTGCYKAKAIRFDAMDRENPDVYDWENPVATLETRSLADLLATVRQFMEENS